MSRILEVFGLNKIIAALLVLMAGTLTANAQSSYRISPGDQLRVEVLEDTALNRTLLVLPDGSISFPFVGSLKASGKTVGTVERTLAQRLAGNFATAPTVFVTVGALAEKKLSSAPADDPYGIYLMGEINTPGRLDIEEDLEVTLLQAIAQAGGFTRFAATKRVELRRPHSGGEQIYVYNHKKGGGISGATVLAPGDVIVVPERRLFE